MEKIKKSMRREDGFTLVELLAVIVILGIILAIAIPAIGGVVRNAKEDAAKQEQGLIVDAGRLYFTTSSKIDATAVTVKTLIDEGYLEIRNVTDPTGGVKKVVDTTNNKIITQLSHLWEDL